MVEINGRARIRSLVFLRDGKYFLSGGDDAMIRQWRISDGVEVGEGMKTGSVVTAMDLSANGKWLVSGGERVANVWSMKSRQVVFTVSEHSEWVDTVHVSPDSTKPATGSNDKKTFIWDLSTGQLLVGPLEHTDRVGAVRFSPDGTRIVTCTTADKGLRIYDARNGALMNTIPVAITSYLMPITWSSTHSVFALVSQKVVMHIDVDSGQTASSWTIPGDPNLVASSLLYAFGSIAVSRNGRFVVSFVGVFVSFWDTVTSARNSSDIRLPTNIWSIALSSDDKYLAIGDQNGKITLRELKDIVSDYYLQRPVQLPRNRGDDIEVLRAQLRSLQLRIDEIGGITMQRNDAHEASLTARLNAVWGAKAKPAPSYYVEEQLSRPIGLFDGIYRIKPYIKDLYLTGSQSGGGAVDILPLDTDNISQRWRISAVADGAYSIVGRIDDTDVPLNVGDSDALVCIPPATERHNTWTIEPRGDAYVIGNAEDARAICYNSDDLTPYKVQVSIRNNTQRQRWILERVAD